MVCVADASSHWPDTFCDKGGHVAWPGHIDADGDNDNDGYGGDGDDNDNGDGEALVGG